MEQGYIDPNFPNPGTADSATIIIYGYTPSLVVAILGIVLFTIALPAHIYLVIRHRTWYFIPMSVGLVMEIVGYIFRLLSSQQNPYSVPWFVVQYFFIVCAPVTFSAAIYTIASILVKCYGRQYALLSPKVILWVFIVCDVIATIIQVAGAALIGVAYSNQKDPTTPNNILLAGLAFQVAAFFLFLCILATTLWRSRKSPMTISASFLVALIIATLAVYLRTCFRLAETAEGLMESLSTHEVFFGCLEFLPIVVAVYALLIWHPGKWLSESRVDFDSKGTNTTENGLAFRAS